MSAERPNKIACLIPLTLDQVGAYSADLAVLFQNTDTLRTYISIKQLKTFRISGRAIIWRLRDIYAQSGGRFYVVSERPGRTLICAF
jgi:hypothetical protein